LAGGVPVQVVMVEGVTGVKYAPKPPGMYKNGKKRAVSLKIAKNAVFYFKVLNKICSRDVF
jgi:hypothetical protein